MTEREALKLAIDFIERVNKDGWILADFEPEMYATITAIKEALAQPEQEPVTWRNAAIRVGEDLCSVGPFGYYDMTAKQWLDWALSVVTVHAPPPQRTWEKPWVSLTDEDIQEAYDTHRPYIGKIMYAIEAKLKEKNT